jgi:STAS-like domain of unknown function (DUF4325)
VRTISIAKDFTRYPSGRYMKHSRTSGEEFRERFLIEPLAKGERILVDLDGTIGYGSSFLEEAFGGAARVSRLPSNRVLELIGLKAEDTSLVDEIVDYVRSADLGAARQQ